MTGNHAERTFGLAPIDAELVYERGQGGTIMAWFTGRTASHPHGWFQSLGHRMGSLDVTRYLGMSTVLRMVASILG